MIYTDVDWVGSPIDHRSTFGYWSYVWGNLVTWRSKKQTVVARSSTEAEFKALANEICESMWIKSLLEELQFPIDICEIDHHFTKEKIDDGIINLGYMLTTLQTIDILTKDLPRVNFEEMKSKLGMLNIYNPT
ncbi:hypothetical protein AAG906_037905 [Vitis piasezkii]